MFEFPFAQLQPLLDAINEARAMLRSAPMPYWNRDSCLYCGEMFDKLLPDRHQERCWWKESREVLERFPDPDFSNQPKEDK